MKFYTAVILIAGLMFGCLNDTKSGAVSGLTPDASTSSLDATNEGSECEVDADCPASGPLGCGLTSGSWYYEEWSCEQGHCVQDISEEICDFGCEHFLGCLPEIECELDDDCDDGNPCTTAMCKSGVCDYTNMDTQPLCSGPDCVYDTLSDFDCDGTSCTLGDFCLEGQCISGDFGCVADDPCITATCEEDLAPWDGPVCLFQLNELNPQAECLNSGKVNWMCVESSCESCETDDDCGIGGGALCDGDTMVSTGTTGACAAGGYCELTKSSEECTNGCGGGDCIPDPFGFCNSDDDCVGSGWGPYCYPGQQAESYGFSGLCQDCLQATEPGGPAGCESGEKCSWGIIGAYNEVDDATVNRSYYWCAL
jgi:hypothetical protein